MASAPKAMVTPGAVRDRMAVWICWLVLNWRSFSRVQGGMVQPEGSPPAAFRAVSVSEDVYWFSLRGRWYLWRILRARNGGGRRCVGRPFRRACRMCFRYLLLTWPTCLAQSDVLECPLLVASRLQQGTLYHGAVIIGVDRIPSFKLFLKWASSVRS